MYSELLFSCTVTKKDSQSQRILKLYQDVLIIIKNDTQVEDAINKKKAKFLYINQIDTKFEWILKFFLCKYVSNNKLQGFKVLYLSKKDRKEKKITYLANNEIMMKLKSLMNGKSIYMKIDNQYQFIQRIENKKGKNLFRCRCKFTNQIKVAKIIPMINSALQLDLQEQTKILITLNNQPHKYLLKIDEIFLEDNHLICIMNYCKGGTLYHYLCNRNLSIEFDTATRITKKILKGVEHLHSMGIIHRDLKLDNIMFEEENNIKSLKIIDFEFSTFNDSRNSLRCGTLGYMAPEVLNGEEYSYKCDIYSLGCIFHAILTGKKLYPTDISSEQLLVLNKQNKFKLSSKVFHTKAYEILLQMLKNKAQRPTASELLNCELFQDKFKRNEIISYFIKTIEFPQLKNPFQTQN